MTIDVRPCTVADLPALRAVEPPGSDLATTFFTAQQAGEVVYLIAWDGSEPLGTGVLTSVPGTPELKNVNVRAEFRSRGVGTQLIRAAEQLYRDRGEAALQIGVAVDNPRARALYERLGYTVVGEPSIVTYTYVDDDGDQHTVTETSEQLARPL